ncbi:MAG: M48 family metallopeptidase [Candidatus Gracilibacteria bacterium]|jgi:heat shock protein HtpX
MAFVYHEITTNKVKSVILFIGFMVFFMIFGFVMGEASGSGGGYGGLILAGIIAIIYGLFGYFLGSKIALSSAGAKKIDRQNLPQIYNMVENLCIAGGIPTPEIYIMDDPALNAFATGRDPQHSAIALTRGIIEKLDKQELEAVIAHELSHVGNYDIRFGMLVIALVGAISIMANIFLRFSLNFRGNKKSGQIQLVMILLAIALSIFGPLIAMLIQLAISRKREYLADASGALLIRNPGALADALEKISGNSVLMKMPQSNAHLCISNPLKKGFFSGLFSTHPPIEERIKRLREMA